jgi:hypothetical protein
MRNTNAVWLPSNLTEAAQKILAVPTSPTQRMDRFLLKLSVANKIVRMATDEEMTDEEARSILIMDPDLATAIGPVTGIRPMAEAALLADNLSLLISESDLSSKPVTTPKALESLEQQTLVDWVGNLQRASLEN